MQEKVQTEAEKLDKDCTQKDKDKKKSEMKESKEKIYQCPNLQIKKYSANEHSSGECVEPNDPESKNKPIPFPQEALNDLCRDLYLTKEKSSRHKYLIKNIRIEGRLPAS
ncbi:Hypothetical predicted protein [Octopus vulgaris]|uniref:Uncharacterized protein n=1 Tax=Octopus vulgaris TaxID=6645 RepID=A0AA36ALP8_OCTVU|nr:Hypothetical predicted protein [Octopus vulgaris]